jgi:uncharacterized membrane protein required for colicin V production
MIAAATQAAHGLALDKMPLNWFDVALVLALVIGYFRGRKNGMTNEILPVLQWICLVVICGLGYEMASQIFYNIANLGKTASLILGYLLLAFLVWLLFALLKKIFMPRLTGSNFFGSNEYYLGIISGVIRYACILLFALALLNAPYYTQAEIAAHKAYVSRWYGGGMYSGEYFPTWQNVQESVFKTSFSGSYIKKYLGSILINSAPKETAPAAKPQPVMRIGN